MLVVFIMQDDKELKKLKQKNYLIMSIVAGLVILIYAVTIIKLS